MFDFNECGLCCNYCDTMTIIKKASIDAYLVNNKDEDYAVLTNRTRRIGKHIKT
jgi:ribosomal protein S15P/S13E